MKKLRNDCVTKYSLLNISSTTELRHYAQIVEQLTK